MPVHRCQAAGCGRFVSAAGERCAKHRDIQADRTLDPEIDAMRSVLEETLAKIKDTELRARLVPRIVSVSIQAIKTGHQLGGQTNSELMELLEHVLTDIGETID